MFIQLMLSVLVVISLASAGVALAILRRTSNRQSAEVEQAIREELRTSREEASTAARNLRQEIHQALATTLASTADTLVKAIGEIGSQQKGHLEALTTELRNLTDGTQNRLEAIRGAIDVQLKQLHEGNEKKLDEMRKTVDEQLHGALERRLGESFKLVSDRLEAVQRGLGEMQNLAAGVGDLKRVLTNVKTRGTWGEIQLGAILEQILTPEQYAMNVQTKDDSQERVEYAVRLPGRAGDSSACVWLPIDSKFPQEAYTRLLDATEAGDAAAAQAAATELGRAIRGSAQSIAEKYVAPPRTTDFAILFVPTEGLYAEILRQTALVEDMQQRYHVMIAGPTTLAATLNSLRVGFRTLAIEQRASEVWRVLGAVKTEFRKFGEVLDRVKRQLTTASRTIEETGVRTRAMARKLGDVEQLPQGIAAEVLELPEQSEATSSHDLVDIAP
jgi:DNA recombination protein RmuC